MTDTPDAPASDRLSRWTPAIFACALANFVLALLLIAAGAAWPIAADAAPATLVDVHLFTVGWLTLLMFGALFQFVPVITARKLLSQHLSLATLVCVEPGLAAMIAGLLLLGHGARRRAAADADADVLLGYRLGEMCAVTDRDLVEGPVLDHRLRGGSAVHPVVA